MSLVKISMICAPALNISRSDLEKAALALSIQAQQHFALPPPFGYGIGASVRVATSPFDVQPDEWVLALLVTPDIDGALGYHDQTPHGLPVLKVFPLLDASDGARWEVTASHEVLEALADPNCARMVQSYDGRLYALEICDACETKSYEIGGVPVSDFVLPAYFEPVKKAVKFDYMGLISQPLEILEGGYGQVFDPKLGWQQVFSQKQAPRAYRAQHAGRRSKRLQP